MKDLHSYLDDRAVMRKIRDLYASLKRSYKTIVILAPYKKIPLDLEKEIYFLRHAAAGPRPAQETAARTSRETLKGDPRVQRRTDRRRCSTAWRTRRSG